MLFEVLKSFKANKLSEREITEYLFRELMAGMYPYMIYMENTGRKEIAKKLYDLREKLFEVSVLPNPGILTIILALTEASKILSDEVDSAFAAQGDRAWESTMLHGCSLLTRKSLEYFQHDYKVT